jgi:hypothetical protein
VDVKWKCCKLHEVGMIGRESPDLNLRRANLYGF